MIGQDLRDGRYTISGALGRGSQADTFEAVDKLNGRLVAIKRFQVKGASSWKDVELAEREARVLQTLSHPSLPSFIEHFEQDGALCLVMEKIDGSDLRYQKTRSVAEVLHFLRDSAAVLGYLHRQIPPVIHRDIKPGNVIRHAGGYSLVDFGSVRDGLKPKGGSTVVGTFGYMAPEQFQGRARPGSDVYGAGVTALWMLTGVEPEDQPHRGLAIDVPSAMSTLRSADFGGRRAKQAWVAALSQMLDPNPDTRAESIAPLLTNLVAPSEPPRGEREPNGGRSSHSRPQPAPSPAEETGTATTPGRSATRYAIPPLLAVALVLAISVARVSVAVTLRVIVPVVLTLVSVLFGRALLRSSRHVKRAGRRAGLALHRAQRRVQRKRAGRRFATPESADSVSGSAGQTRIATDDPEVDEAMDDFDEALAEAGAQFRK